MTDNTDNDITHILRAFEGMDFPPDASAREVLQSLVRDLRSPVTSIEGFVTILGSQETLGSTDEIKAIVREMRTRVAFLQALIRAVSQYLYSSSDGQR